jgi:fructose-1-phosphate kinase PfkB-like protein
VVRVLEADREHRYVVVQDLPPLPSRPYARVLLSMGEKGLLMPVRDASRVADVPEVKLHHPKNSGDHTIDSTGRTSDA